MVESRPARPDSLRDGRFTPEVNEAHEDTAIIPAEYFPERVAADWRENPQAAEQYPCTINAGREPDGGMGSAPFSLRDIRLTCCVSDARVVSRGGITLAAAVPRLSFSWRLGARTRSVAGTVGHDRPEFSSEPSTGNGRDLESRLAEETRVGRS